MTNPIARLYQAVALTLGQRFLLDEKASHHVGRVLRAKTGEWLTIFNGQGGEYLAEITAIQKKGVEVKIESFFDQERKSPVKLILAQGIARGEKMDFIIQKAVELGVQEIVPLFTEHGNVRLSGDRSEKREQHWQTIAISACEQSGRNDIPQVRALTPFNHWIKAAQADICLVLSPHKVANFSLSTLKKPSSMIILVGPEGGLSHQELALAEDHGFLAWQLGPRILRTETAGFAALSVLQFCFGDFASEGGNT